MDNTSGQSRIEAARGDAVWIFVDNSNIWIEAKKTKAADLDPCFKEDPRVRIDVGRLADLISNGQPVKHATLYGSEPPPIDTVWKKIQEKNYEVKTFKRSTYTNKEKEVDHQIIADVTETVVLPGNRKYGSKIILVSGDRDMTPCVEKAIKYKWEVDIWAIGSGLSNRLKKLEKKHPESVTVCSLSEYMDNFTFTNERYLIDERNKGPLFARGIVLTECVSNLNRFSSNEWLDLKETLDNLKLPWQYAWLVDKHSFNVMGHNLLVMPSPDPSNKMSDDNLIREFKQHLEKRCEKRCFEKVLTFFDYDAREKYVEKYEICRTNRFEEFKDDDDDDDADEEDCDDSDDDGEEGKQNSAESADGIKDVSSSIKNPSAPQPEGSLAQASQDRLSCEDCKDEFQQVKRKRKRKYQKYSNECAYHYQCVKARKCTDSHNDDEKQFFDHRNNCYNPNAVNRKSLWRHKTVMCPNVVQGSPCIYGEQCRYAHYEGEHVCCNCHMQGHPTNKCPKLF